MSAQYVTQTLNHFGIVAGVCEKIDLIGQIDARISEIESLLKNKTNK